MPPAVYGISRHTSPKLYFTALLVCAALLTAGVAVAFTPQRRASRAGSLVVDRGVPGPREEPVGERAAGQKAQSEGRATASALGEEVGRRYAEMAGLWSDDANCGAATGHPLRVSADGLDLGDSHFHVESVELNGRSVLLHGHYITRDGIKQGDLDIVQIKSTPLQLRILQKTYLKCS